MFTSIIKELSGTKMAECNEIIAIMPNIKQMMNIKGYGVMPLYKN